MIPVLQAEYVWLEKKKNNVCGEEICIYIFYATEMSWQSGFKHYELVRIPEVIILPPLADPIILG